MVIECALGNVFCKNDEQITNTIQKCAAYSLDDIWIYLNESEQYPCLTILTNSEKTCVHFFDGEKMYQSKGDMGANGTIPFCPGGETNELPAYTVISLKQAITCAKEFAHTGKRPSSIEWNEL